MDGENNGSNPIEMGDLGGFPTIFGNTHMFFWDHVFFSFKSNGKHGIMVHSKMEVDGR